MNSTTELTYAAKIIRAIESEDQSTLIALAHDADKEIRTMAAQNPLLPADTLAELALDSELSVRWNVASNENTDSDNLNRLADDTDVWLRVDVAKNPSTRPETLSRLALDSEELVRKHIANRGINVHTSSVTEIQIVSTPLSAFTAI